MTFILDSRLEADSFALAEWPLCTIRLMNDARFPWLILIPKRDGLREWIDLSDEDAHRMTDEIRRASRLLKDLTGADKLNIGMLGNIVPQLHVHVVARQRGDPAWPGPVWGNGERREYNKENIKLMDSLIAHLK